MAKLIGTAGHVDHGKTTLIRALTSIDADRLPEEKRRGMTIDIGFAYIDLPRAGRVSMVDVPGHERFLSNMLIGALGIDVAMLCIAADESVMPQTREHLSILGLLPVERLVVAMTRADLADADMRAISLEEIEELLESSRFKGCPVIAVSAETGEGLDELRLALDEALELPESQRSGGWYLPIDRVFSVKGYGTVVTGTLAQGEVKIDDRAVLMPSGQETRIRGIEWHGESQTQSEKGRRTALNLGKVSLDEVHRGMIVGDPNVVFASQLIEARVQWVHERKHAWRIRLSIGADEVMGKILLNDHDPELVQFKLERPVAVVAGQPLIVRRYSPPTLLGGGRVTEPIAKLRKKSEKSVSRGEGLTEEDQILEWIEASAWGETTEEICRRMGKTPQALGNVFEKLKAEGRLIGFAGKWLTPPLVEKIQELLRTTLRQAHEEIPARAFLPRDAILKQARVPWTGKPLDRLLAHLAQAEAIRISGTEIAEFDHVVRLNSKQELLLQRVIEGLDACGMNVPPALELSKQLQLPPQAVEEMFRLGLESRRLVWIAESVIYTVEQLARIRSEWAAKVGESPFTAAEFRDHYGSTRKYAIPLLEWMDAQGWTKRLGDSRVMA